MMIFFLSPLGESFLFFFHLEVLKGMICFFKSENGVTRMYNAVCVD
jgi:hypothetical protein